LQLYNESMNNSLEFIGLFGAFLLIIFYYRHVIKSFFVNPKESLAYAAVIIMLGFLFFLLFQAKGF